MLLKTHSFKSEAVDFTTFMFEANKLLNKYKPEQLQIRLGLEWDDWNQQKTPIQICVYKKETK